MITNRLSKWCEEENVISCYQAAYRRGMGCEDHIFTLNSVLQHNLKTRKGKVFALFVDLSGAFDSVQHDKLWRKLHKIGLSDKMINSIKDIYSKAKAKIRTKEGESDFFPFRKAVLQGETLSPKLWTIFLDDLVETMHKSKLLTCNVGKARIHLLIYADDIVLLSTNAPELQEKIDILKSYLEYNDLKINLKKTNLVVFRNGKSRKPNPMMFWGNDRIEEAKSYKYLGVEFNNEMNYNQISKNFTVKAKIAENQLFNLFFKASIINCIFCKFLCSSIINFLFKSYFKNFIRSFSLTKTINFSVTKLFYNFFPFSIYSS